MHSPWSIARYFAYFGYRWSIVVLFDKALPSAATTSAPSFESSFALSELTFLVTARALNSSLLSLWIARTKPLPYRSRRSPR